jgi:hypothetical protein
MTPAEHFLIVPTIYIVGDVGSVNPIDFEFMSGY